MDKVKTTANLQQRHLNAIQRSVNDGVVHFDVLELQDYNDEQRFAAKAYFKIALSLGANADTKKLIFSNPKSSDFHKDLHSIRNGFYCIFNQAFFHSFGNLADYLVFQSDGNMIFKLTDRQQQLLKEIFERMVQEFRSDYVHKYDMIRIILSELIHFGIKEFFASIKLKNV